MRPFSLSVTSLTYPLSVPSMRHLPLAPVRYLPDFTAIPLALAFSSVRPTEAISGVVYTQLGTTDISSGGFLPVITATAFSPWALATCASWMFFALASPMT